MKYNELSEQEKKAIKEALQYIGYCHIAKDTVSIQEWLDDDTISICTGRNKRAVVWIITDSSAITLYIDTLDVLSGKELLENFL